MGVAGCGDVVVCWLIDGWIALAVLVRGVILVFGGGDRIV